MRDLTYQEIMMLEGLYEEALGLPTDHQKVSMDDGAYKSWNHYVKALKKDRLLTGPTNKQSYVGNAPPMTITAKGKAEYERIKGTPDHLGAVKWWEGYVAELRAGTARSDAAFGKR